MARAKLRPWEGSGPEFWLSAEMESRRKAKIPVLILPGSEFWGPGNFVNILDVNKVTTYVLHKVQHTCWSRSWGPKNRIGNWKMGHFGPFPVTYAVLGPRI